MTSTYPRRQEITPAAALRVLLDRGIDRLPVDLNIICEQLGVKALSYRAADKWRCAAQMWARRGGTVSVLERELRGRFSPAGSRKDLAAP